jgi:hypothetical protein
MPTIEEMTAWTHDELQAEVSALLPTGWRFRSGWDGTMLLWTAAIERPDENGEWITAWEDESPDERLLLFNAFGHLWLERQPKTASDSPWAVRQPVPRGPVTRPMGLPGVKVPDPEDLDPAEIDSLIRSR